MDYRLNLECSARVFKSKLVKYKNDLHKAVVAYNQGTPCICEDGFFKMNLGRTRITCTKKVSVMDKLTSKIKQERVPLRCSNKGDLYETKYLKDFLLAYNT